MKQKVPESGVLRACLDLLAAEKIWHERRNVGAVKNGNRFIRFGVPGTADILAIPLVTVELICDADEPDTAKSWLVRWVAGARFNLWKWKQPRPLWIECKSDTGKQTEKQAEFEREAKKAGHAYLLVRDSDELKAWLKANGAI